MNAGFEPQSLPSTAVAIEDAAGVDRQGAPPPDDQRHRCAQGIDVDGGE